MITSKMIFDEILAIKLTSLLRTLEDELQRKDDFECGEIDTQINV